MSAESDKAIREAEESLASFSENLKGTEVVNASHMARIRIAKELTLIRGEMRAMRILLSEQDVGAVAGLGSDHGNP